MFWNYKVGLVVLSFLIFIVLLIVLLVFLYKKWGAHQYASVQQQQKQQGVTPHESVQDMEVCNMFDICSFNVGPTLPSISDVGVVALVVDVQGKICNINAIGRNTENFDIKKELTRVHHGSCTKAMTCTLLAILMESGRLQATWDSTLPELLPTLTIHDDYKNTTLRDVVCMKAGIPENPPDWWVYNRDDIRKGREHATKDALKKRKHTPSTYSNWAYVVVGHVIERHLNMLWEDALLIYMFQPLGVCTDRKESFGVVPSHHLYGHMANGTPCYNCDNSPVLGPAGTFSGSLQATAAFIGLHIKCHNQDTDILKQSNCVVMHKVSPGDNYAYGWVFEDGGNIITHNGSNTHNYMTITINFAQKKGMMVFSNGGNENNIQAVQQVINEIK